MRRKELAFQLIRLERVAGDIETENLFLFGQTFAFTPGCDVRKANMALGFRLSALGGRAGLACRARRAESRELPKQRHLPALALLLTQRRLVQRRVQRRPTLRALGAQRIERAGRDQGLEDALVAQP